MSGFTVALTDATHGALATHLLRCDGQEDVCAAVYQVSGAGVVVSDVIVPRPGERKVHGNASFTGDFVIRAALVAAEQGGGVVIAHSHPGAHGWQQLSRQDADAEASFAHLVSELTDLPLVGMTLAGDGHWSARRWDSRGGLAWAGAVRVVGERLTMSYNESLRPPPPATSTQVRTVSAWGSALHRDITRLRVLVVGVGSVGLDVVARLAATGVVELGVMDFDRVEWLNLDRLVGATAVDAAVRRSKVDVAARIATRAATAPGFVVHRHALSICEPDGLAAALTYDVIFSCVDRPWPRSVLNSVAYSDLIPVIDGGIHIDAFADAEGGGMRGCTWRSHVLRPGRPCLVCNGQLDASLVAVDREGLLEDPTYIAGSGLQPRARQNVAALSVSVSSSLLAQFVSLVAAPGGIGEPGPLRYVLAMHALDVVACSTAPSCTFESLTGAGDRRLTLTGTHPAAHDASPRVGWRPRLLGAIAAACERLLIRLDRYASKGVRVDRSGPSTRPGSSVAHSSNALRVPYP
jgi:hypothetical protein